MNWWLQSVQQPDVDAKQQAEQHQLQLTKPTGALGDLELIAVKLASLQSNAHPQVSHPWITVFAGDHGVVEEKYLCISSNRYPSNVTKLHDWWCSN